MTNSNQPIKICDTCGLDCDNWMLVVIDSDTGASLFALSYDDCRKEMDQHFVIQPRMIHRRYRELVESGRYPHMTAPQFECKECRMVRFQIAQQNLVEPTNLDLE